MFWSVGWPLLWAGGFFCNLDILYGGLGIGKLQFLIKKKFNFFPAVIFFQFLVIKALDPYWIRIRIRIRNPDPVPYWSPTSNSGSGSGFRIRIRILIQYGSRALMTKNWKIRIGLQRQTLDPDPDPEKMNTDPQHWKGLQIKFRQLILQLPEPSDHNCPLLSPAQLQITCAERAPDRVQATDPAAPRALWS
jgi:hypothetical protein